MAKSLQHIHILIKAEIDYPKALDFDELKDWASELVQEQGLEPVAGPFVSMVTDEGNKGPTGGVHIKTSHLAFHIWEEIGMMQADLYTCGDLDVDKFLARLAVFGPSSIEYMVLDRQSGFKVLEAGTLYPSFDYFD